MDFSNYISFQHVLGFGLQKVPDAVLCFQYVVSFGHAVVFGLPADKESFLNSGRFLPRVLPHEARILHKSALLYTSS